MALTPPARCLRGIVKVPQAAADRRGATSASIPCALWIADTIIGDQWMLAIQLRDGWKDISVPSAVPNISDGKMYGDGEREQIAAEINQMGAKMWALREIQEWASKLVYAEFKDDIPAAPSGPVAITSSNYRDAVNAAMADTLVFLDTNGDGIPEVHGK